ncbi:variant erythrocyte surface antigen-1 family protein [Babesia caballi]|uniref:Variant erythrocyte surface antigen-1 family protein n=1 Tax=Babesia caballi TaxID=5871 RepID=A0AAV4LXN3_BABCB|nr:variant erythrocyte surface antigen-1 family protein [Babesia caballi]
MGADDLLKTPPSNLKEAIDWLALVGGGFGGRGCGDFGMSDKLEEALKKLNGFDNIAQTKLSLSNYSGLINALAKGLGRGFLGYDGQNSTNFNGSGIVKKVGSKYQSSYHNANWEHNNDTTYAKIFLFLAPLVYYFITFLYWMCNKNSWKRKQLNSTGGSNPLFYLMLYMGYSQPQLNEKKTGDTIADRLGGHDGFNELSDAYQVGSASSSYSTFIEKLERNGPSKGIDAPLTNCKIFCYAYLKSKQKDNAITDAIHAVKGELVNLSTSSDISSTGDFSALQEKITNLLGEIPGLDPNLASSEPGSDGPQKPGSSGTGSQSPSPSPAGPVAGTLTTLGLGGGAAAAYVFNLGGAKTLVNGLLRIG